LRWRGLPLFAGFAPRPLIGAAMAQSAAAALVAKPVSLPDMTLGSEKGSRDHHRIRVDELPATARHSAKTFFRC